MDTERVLGSQTILVEGDRITAIGPVDEVAVPDRAEIIEGNGAYLMPGLADMHTHLFYDADPAFMRLFLAEGVTTVRNLNAIVPDHLEWRDQIAKGKWEDIGILQKPEYRVVRPELITEWQESGRLVNWRGQEAYRREAWRSAMMQLTKAMQDHGALLTLGTDTTVEGIIPGYSAHQELSLLVESGLSNFEALATDTRNAAQ